jgi:uncharacterized protein YbaR (Trm112 family)
MKKMSKKVVKTNLSMLACKKLNEMGKEWWNAVLFLKDKELENLTENEAKFLEVYNEYIKVVSENVRLTAIYESALSKPEIEKWVSEFLLECILSKDNIQKKRDAVDIGCPACKTKLVFVKTMRAETLSEHVCGDDNYISKKDMYGCPNHDCFVNEKGLTWLEDGEGFYSNCFTIKSDDSRFIDKNSQPFRTWNRKYEAGRERIVNEIAVGNVMIQIAMSCKADENGKKSWNKSIRFKIFTRKNKEDLGWTLYSSFLHSFLDL